MVTSSNFTTMRTLLIITIAIALAFAIYALASGPGIIEIIDNPKL
jgi:hypothetical protein